MKTLLQSVFASFLRTFAPRFVLAVVIIVSGVVGGKNKATASESNVALHPFLLPVIIGGVSVGVGFLATRYHSEKDRIVAEDIALHTGSLNAVPRLVYSNEKIDVQTGIRNSPILPPITRNSSEMAWYEETQAVVATYRRNADLETWKEVSQRIIESSRFVNLGLYNRGRGNYKRVLIMGRAKAVYGGIHKFSSHVNGDIRLQKVNKYGANTHPNLNYAFIYAPYVEYKLAERILLRGWRYNDKPLIAGGDNISAEEDVAAKQVSLLRPNTKVWYTKTKGKSTIVWRKDYYSGYIKLPGEPERLVLRKNIPTWAGEQTVSYK